MTKLILSLLLLLSSASALFAEHTLSAPYVGYTDYDSNDTQRENSYDIGIFSRSSDENNTYDIFLNYNYITNNSDSNDTNSSDTNSTDSNIKNISLSLLKKYNLTEDIKLLAAINYNLSTDDRYDQVFSLLGGIEKNIDIIKLGFNASYSKYNSDALASSAAQASPHFGFYFGHPDSIMGNFYTKVMYDMIFLKSPNSSVERRYRSHALNITHFKHGFETNVQLWFGESLYAVRSNGLINQFLDIVYKDGVFISLKYNISDETAIQISSLSQTYLNVGESEDSKLKSYILSAYFRF